MQTVAEAQSSYDVPIMIGLFYLGGATAEFAFPNIDEAQQFYHEVVAVKEFTGLVHVSMRRANFSLN